MTPTGRTPRERAAEALEHLELALVYSHRDLSEQITIDAIALRLSAGLEALGALDEDVCAHLVGGSWAAMRGLRNRIAHGYTTVNPVYIVRIIEDDLAPVIKALREYLTVPDRRELTVRLEAFGGGWEAAIDDQVILVTDLARAEEQIVSHLDTVNPDVDHSAWSITII